MASFEFTELKIRRTIVRKSIVYSETRYAFTDPTGTVFRGTLAPKCCGMRGFSIKLASEEDEALLTFDVSTCAGFCDKYEVLDSAGATAAQLFEPSCFGKLCQALLPCRGGQLILSAKDSAGEPMFDLRTPPACICACKCGCTLQCGCCSCCKDLVVMLAITQPGTQEVMAELKVTAPMCLPMPGCASSQSIITCDLTEMGKAATVDAKRAIMALGVMADALFAVPQVGPCS